MAEKITMTYEDPAEVYKNINKESISEFIRQKREELIKRVTEEFEPRFQLIRNKLAIEIFETGTAIEAFNDWNVTVDVSNKLKSVVGPIGRFREDLFIEMNRTDLSLVMDDIIWQMLYQQRQGKDFPLPDVYMEIAEEYSQINNEKQVEIDKINDATSKLNRINHNSKSAKAAYKELVSIGINLDNMQIIKKVKSDKSDKKQIVYDKSFTNRFAKNMSSTLEKNKDRINYLGSVERVKYLLKTNATSCKRLIIKDIDKVRDTQSSYIAKFILDEFGFNEKLYQVLSNKVTTLANEILTAGTSSTEAPFSSYSLHAADFLTSSAVDSLSFHYESSGLLMKLKNSEKTSTLYTSLIETYPELLTYQDQIIELQGEMRALDLFISKLNPRHKLEKIFELLEKFDLEIKEIDNLRPKFEVLKHETIDKINQILGGLMIK